MNGYIWPTLISIIGICFCCQFIDTGGINDSLTFFLPIGTIDYPSLMKYDASSQLVGGRQSIKGIVCKMAGS